MWHFKVNHLSGDVSGAFQLMKLLAEPNTYDSFDFLMQRIEDRLEERGYCLLWVISNQFGLPAELQVVGDSLVRILPNMNSIRINQIGDVSKLFTIYIASLFGKHLSIEVFHDEGE